MNKKELFQYIENELNNRNLKIKILIITKTGSHLYGTNTENSDEDFVGIFVPLEKKYFYGFHNIEEIDLSKQIKDAFGKNTKDSLDLKLYSLKKFTKLAMENNPNIIELLYAHTNKDAIVYNTPEFQLLEKNAIHFINKRAYKTFLGYAKSQLKKGVQKPENFNLLTNLKNDIEKVINKENNSIPLGEAVQTITELNKYKKYLHNNGFVLGHLTFPRNYHLKKILRMVNEKIETSSHRAKEWQEKGYDTKFWMHLFRLLDEGKNLITNKKLEFPLKNKKFLLDVRNGKYTLQQLQKMFDKKYQQFKLLENNELNNLPDKANINYIENMIIDITDKILQNNLKQNNTLELYN